MEDMTKKAEDMIPSQEMSDVEKEKAYRRAVEYLFSSLTNEELIEESLKTLEALGDYKNSAELYQKCKAQQAVKKEEADALAKKRRMSRILQGITVGIGAVLVLGLVVLLVYLLKLDIVR